MSAMIPVVSVFNSGPFEGTQFWQTAVPMEFEQLERDLARARTGGASVETLQAEVEQLRAALAVGSPSQDDVSHGLVSVRSRLHDLGEELGEDAVIGAEYLARIGRLLGLT